MSKPQPATRLRTCRACGKQFEYPIKGNPATRFHCEECVGLHPDTRKVAERLFTRSAKARANRKTPRAKSRGSRASAASREDDLIRTGKSSRSAFFIIRLEFPPVVIAARGKWNPRKMPLQPLPSPCTLQTLKIDDFGKIWSLRPYVPLVPFVLWLRLRRPAPLR